MKHAIVSKSMPTKWIVAIIAIAILYGVLQPVLNRQFGLNLPSVVELLQEDKPGEHDKATQGDSRRQERELPAELVKRAPRESDPKLSQAQSPTDIDLETSARSEIGQGGKPAKLDASTSETAEKTKSQSPASAEAKNGIAEKASSASPHSDDPYDYLTTVGNQTYRSPQGLIYRRGSAEGHRLKHLERHLQNDASRPGPHGVFEGTLTEFLVKIDETYQRAKRKDKGTKSYTDEGRTIYETSFPDVIGHLGGQEGRRKNNPKLKRIRLVVDGDAVITAFPF